MVLAGTTVILADPLPHVLAVDAAGCDHVGAVGGVGEHEVRMVRPRGKEERYD